MRAGLSNEQKIERRKRLDQNHRIEDAAVSVICRDAENPWIAGAAVAEATLACVRAWREILADYR